MIIKLKNCLLHRCIKETSTTVDLQNTDNKIVLFAYSSAGSFDPQTFNVGRLYGTTSIEPVPNQIYDYTPYKGTVTCTNINRFITITCAPI
jgi:hypothetical protein